jgi:hypothetical protein
LEHDLRRERRREGVDVSGEGSLDVDWEGGHVRRREQEGGHAGRGQPVRIGEDTGRTGFP